MAEDKPEEEKTVGGTPADAATDDASAAVAEKPVTEKPVTEKPVTEKPAAEKPVAAKTVRAKTVRAKTVRAKPVTEKPVTEKPAAEKRPGGPTEPEAPRVEVLRRRLTDLKSLSSTAAAREEPVAAEAPLLQPQRDARGRAYATGRRKESVARVWVLPGQGRVTVNGRDSNVYFARPVLRMLIHQPLVAAQRDTQFDVWCTVKGGGLSGQAGAVRHGISRALVNYEPDLRPVLKAGGFLTRDARTVERKKYGRAKARRSFQFSKR